MNDVLQIKVKLSTTKKGRKDLFHCRKNNDEDGKEKLKGIAEKCDNAGDIENESDDTENWFDEYDKIASGK
uniref:Uncharacterized protein n=1 Tax=Pristionchus pacificus TaxID=54126 RepID=A0A2A6CAT3_PRIPA|eukprot:PDM75332.1 hypothetical protein PRIPAC_42509 [Pristionchus pacificus]